MEAKIKLYPSFPGRHCLNCFHCKRVIKHKGPAGTLSLFEKNQDDLPAARVRCEFSYWGENPDGTEKRYRSPWIAAKSYFLYDIAQRCPDYDGKDD